MQINLKKTQKTADENFATAFDQAKLVFGGSIQESIIEIQGLKEQLQREREEALSLRVQESKKQKEIEAAPVEEDYEGIMDLNNLEEFLTDPEEEENEQKDGTQTNEHQ